jgi:predicted MFS family arabinose efflux permease
MFGTLHQISIGLGMIVAQALSLVLAKTYSWRYVLLVAEAIALFLLLSSCFIRRPTDSASEQIEEERSLLSPSAGKPCACDA